MNSPCLVSPERDDLVDTDDCMEATDVVSAMVLSVVKPPPSPSVWVVIVDWQKYKKISHKSEFAVCERKQQLVM